MTENRRRWLWIPLVVGAVVLAIALLTTLLTAGGGSNTNAATPPAPTRVSPSPSQASPSPSPRLSATPSLPALHATGPGWGFVSNATRHTLMLELTSSAPVYVQMGWKAPTSSPKGGIYKARVTTWTRTMTVYGSPQYAIFFTYFGGAQAPVRCRIYVDGALRVEKSSSGRYGGLMCVG